jgi:hypothetical protein
MTTSARRFAIPPAAAPTGQVLTQTVAACRTALKSAGIPDHVPEMPDTCFALALGIPFDRAVMAALCVHRDRIACELGIARPAAEARLLRHVVLSAFCHAAPYLAAAAAVDAAVRQACYILQSVAADPSSVPDNAFSDEACAELARLVSLRRFAAGQQSLDFMPIPRAWCLKIHPRDLPAFAAGALRLRGQVIIPHICHWRANRFFISERENERSMLIVADVLRARPALRGVVYSSWLFDPAITACSPNLAWLGAMVVDGGASLFDAGPAIDGAGFAAGSASRRADVARGVLKPRETIVLWPRDRVLAWADGRRCRAAPRSPPVPRTLRSDGRGPLDGRRLLYFRPRRYIAAVFGPPLALALMLGLASGTPTLAITATALLLPLTWLAQYFLLQ